MAVIYAPKTGKCTLRKSASTSSAALKKCKAGTVVIVLEQGEKTCKINVNGTTGYVLTSCLRFYDANTPILGQGQLSYNGKTTGKTTVNVRNTPEKGSAVIGDWKTGTQVQVFSHENGWYEIEYQGMHGYVQEKYLNFEE